MRIFKLLAVLPLLVAAPLFATGEPLYVKNLSPVTGLLGLPSQRDAGTQAAGTLALALHSSIANHYVAESGIAEAVNLDGESLRFAFEARYGLADDWDLQLEIPWLEHSGGHLDSLIENWHSLWGMSDGGRSDAPKNQLDYRYGSQDGGFALLNDVSGLGDITASLSHAFYRDTDSAVSVALGYKFATGEEDDFLGSGADDAFIALRFSGDHLADLPLSWHGQLGYLRAGDSDVMGSAQERDLWFAGLTLDWAVADSLSLIAQIDAHAAPMDSGLTALGDDAILLSLGARWQFSPRWSVDINFVEDARVETAPDVTFQASLRYYGGR